MLDNPLNGRRILVVEDDYLLAESLNDLLVEAGVCVLGPVGNVPEALSLVTSGQTIDGALLDVNVRGQPVFPVADALLERGVPFSFCSGYDRYALPPRFAHLSYCMKPYNPRTITALLSNQAQPAEHY
ncbi:response regulator [Xanthomonas campestris pv. campestris]|nr:response regulator [Xanthomonas campestris pv. campestris]